MGFKNYFRYIGLNHCVYRKLTSNLEVVKPIQTTNEPNLCGLESESSGKSQSKKKSPSLKNIDKVNALFDSHPHLKDLKNIVPASYVLQRPSMKDKFRIFPIDKNVASDIFKMLRPHLKTYNGHVMEMNAGAGVLTEELLKAQLRNFRIYEPDPILCNNLLKLKKLYKSDARLFMVNLQWLSRIVKSDTRDNGDRAATLFSGLPSLNWQDEPVVKLIGTVPDELFIVHIMFSITLQSGLCQYGRPEMFLMIPTEKFEKLTSSPDQQKLYRSNSVTFQILFDYEELTRLPKKAFVPWCLNLRQTRNKNQNDENCSSLSLVKITPKRDLLQTIPPDVFRTIIFFVKFMMHKKSALLINLMEKWVPGSGVRLISRGYTIFTDCGSLTPDEYLKIFLEFTSWPEFYSSSFMPSAESILEKLLKHELPDEIISDTKFTRMVTKDSSVSEEDEDVFDDSTNSEHENKILSADIKGR